LFERQPDLVWGLVAALYVSNFMLLILNIPLVGIFARLLTIPTRYLMPIVVVISYVGVYSISNSAFDLLLMTGFGIIGFGMRKMGFPIIPLVLGMLLGGPMEQNLRRAMQASGGDWSILVASPLSIGLHVVTIAMVLAAIIFELRRRRQSPAAEQI
jgi:putative tricarboxylic transport membrane protein